jgi:hypothetical protein
MEPQKRPSFIDSWLTDVREDYRRYGASALVPWLALVCICFGAGVSLLVPETEFWARAEVSVVFFTAALTINGLLLALSWGSFAKIYELASEPKMASFLRRRDLLKSYIFQVDFIHFAQVAAVSWSGAALILCVVGHLPHAVSAVIPLLILQKISLAGSIASTIYALRYALGAVRIMQDLVWYAAYFIGDERGITVHEGGRDRQ